MARGPCSAFSTFFLLLHPGITDQEHQKKHAVEKKLEFFLYDIYSNNLNVKYDVIILHHPIFYQKSNMPYVPKALQAPRAPLSVHGHKNILVGKQLPLSITLYSKWHIWQIITKTLFFILFPLQIALTLKKCIVYFFKWNWKRRTATNQDSKVNTLKRLKHYPPEQGGAPEQGQSPSLRTAACRT